MLPQIIMLLWLVIWVTGSIAHHGNQIQVSWARIFGNALALGLILWWGDWWDGLG